MKAPAIPDQQIHDKRLVAAGEMFGQPAGGETYKDEGELVHDMPPPRLAQSPTSPLGSHETRINSKPARQFPSSKTAWNKVSHKGFSAQQL